MRLSELEDIVPMIQITKGGCWKWRGDLISRGAIFGVPCQTTCKHAWCVKPSHQQSCGQKKGQKKFKDLTTDELLRKASPRWGGDKDLCWPSKNKVLWTGVQLINAQRLVYEHTKKKKVPKHARIYQTCNLKDLCLNPDLLMTKSELEKFRADKLKPKRRY